VRQELARLMAESGHFETPLLVFLGNLLLSAFLAYVIGLFYTRFGRSTSNRSDFSRNFILLTMTTMVIISVVKSSLALSLGLVGALSIVRFRAAIKDPEELTYLFLCISVGLGLGATQTLITTFSVGVILLVLWGKSHFGTSHIMDSASLFLTVSGSQEESSGLRKILPELKKKFRQVEMKRWEDRAEGFTVSFTVECVDAEQLLGFRDLIRKSIPDARITTTDTQVL